MLNLLHIKIILLSATRLLISLPVALLKIGASKALFAPVAKKLKMTLTAFKNKHRN